jgi:hypothetical protein
MSTSTDRPRHSLRDKEALDVEMPADVVNAITAVEAADRRWREARRILGAGGELLAEWEGAKAEYDMNQDLTTDSADFVPYTEPRPDPDYLDRVAALYGRAKTRAQRNLEAVIAANHSALFDAVSEAWFRWQMYRTNPPDDMTVAEASALKRASGDALNRLAHFAEYLARVQGDDSRQVKNLIRAEVREGRLISLAAARRTEGHPPNRTSGCPVLLRHMCQGRAQAPRTGTSQGRRHAYAPAQRPRPGGRGPGDVVRPDLQPG